MNSRDAAYEEMVQAAMEASKQEAMLANGPEDSDVADEGSRYPVDSVEPAELDYMHARKGKRKREDEDSSECWHEEMKILMSSRPCRTIHSTAIRIGQA